MITNYFLLTATILFPNIFIRMFMYFLVKKEADQRIYLGLGVRQHLTDVFIVYFQTFLCTSMNPFEDCITFSSSQTQLSLGSFCADRALWEMLNHVIILHSSHFMPPCLSFLIQPQHYCQRDFWKVEWGGMPDKVLFLSESSFRSFYQVHQYLWVFSAFGHVLPLAWNAVSITLLQKTFPGSSRYLPSLISVL